MESAYEYYCFDGLERALLSNAKVEVYTTDKYARTGILKKNNYEIRTFDEEVIAILESLSSRYNNIRYERRYEYNETYLNFWISKGNGLTIEYSDDRYIFRLCSPDDKIFREIKSSSFHEGLELLEKYLEYVDIEDVSEIFKGNINYQYEGEEDNFLLKRIKKRIKY